MEQGRGVIQDVQTQVTEDGEEEINVSMSDGKNYSTDDFLIDKQSVITKLQDVDFDDEPEPDRLEKLNNLQKVNFEMDINESNMLDEDENEFEFDDDFNEVESGCNEEEKKKNVKSGFHVMARERENFVGKGETLENMFDDD